MQHRNFRSLQNSNDTLVRSFGMIHFPAFQKMRGMGIKHATCGDSGPFR